MCARSIKGRSVWRSQTSSPNDRSGLSLSLSLDVFHARFSKTSGRVALICPRRGAGHDVDNCDTPHDVGLAFTCDMSKEFGGKQALLADARRPRERRLASLAPASVTVENSVEKSVRAVGRAQTYASPTRRIFQETYRSLPHRRDWELETLGCSSFAQTTTRTSGYSPFKVLADPDAWLFHGEVVYRDGVAVGDVRSGSYGHTLKGAVALAMIKAPTGHTVTPTWINAAKWEVDIAGERVAATVMLRPPYDPKGLRIKA